MSVRRVRPRPLRARRDRYVHLFAERLEERLVLSAASQTSALAPPDSVPQDTGDTGVYTYTPQQIQQAYGTTRIVFGTTPGDGRNQTIAIIDDYDDPNLVDSSSANFGTSDLAKFDRAFGLADPPSFTKYNEDGQTTNLPDTGPIAPGRDSYQTDEALDVEWAHVIAPEASIDLIECRANTSLDDYTGAMTAAGLPGVSVVSMSFAAPEWSGELDYDPDFTTPAGHQGVTFLASAGDQGSPSEYPAASPNVVAVGGTTLFLNPDGSYSGEVGWSKGSDPYDATVGGGGGVSPYEPVPAYQDGIGSLTGSLAGAPLPTSRWTPIRPPRWPSMTRTTMAPTPPGSAPRGPASRRPCGPD